MTLPPTAHQGTFADRYVLDRELGRGATSMVYLARDRQAGRLVALKILRHELIGTISTDRFLREIDRLGRLSHPHIVPLLASGEHQGTPFCVLPYMDEGTLRQRLDRDKQLPIKDVIAIGVCVARALAFAHSRNLIHRDVKPENILFTAGQATLADFGIARALEHSTGESTTSTGIVRGTPAYMSPEQAVGEAELDGRSDIYSLACVLYEAIAGVQAFHGPTSQVVVAQRVFHMPQPLRVYRPSVPAALEAVVERAMATSAADRYRSAEEFADALQSVDSNGPSEPPRLSTATTRVADTLSKRRRWMIGVAAGSLTLTAVATAMWLSRPTTNAAGIPEGDPRRIAVLYLENQTPAALGPHVADGITEDLIDLLVDARQLHVTSANAVRQFRSGSIAFDSIAKLLKAGTIVGGSIAQSGDSVHVNVRLIAGSDGRQMSRATVSAPVGDIFALQRRLADQVSVILRQRVGDIVAVGEHRAATKSTQAWELLQLASNAARRGVNDGILRGDSRAAAAHHQRADSLLARAALLDPAWALPVIRRGRLALSQPPQTSWVPEQADSAAYFAAPPPVRRRLWINRAAALADEALARDAKSAEALALRGATRYALAIAEPPRADSLTRLAESDLRAAIEVRPNLVVAWHTLAQLAQRNGRYAEAAAAAQFAYDLDAFFEVAGVASTGFLSSLRAERFDDADRWCRIGLDHHAGDPRFAECRLTLIGWTGDRRDDVTAAWGELQRIEQADTLGMLGVTSGYRRLMVAAVAARAKQPDSARAVLQSVRDARVRDPRAMEYPIEESYVELLLGNRDRAIALLTPQAQASPAMRVVLANHPWFRPLREDARFAALVAPAR